MPPKRKHAGSTASNASQSPEARKPAAAATEDDAPVEKPSKRVKSAKKGAVDKKDENDEDMDVGDQIFVKKARIINVNGEPTSQEMEKPPKAGLVDPAGFKTNPPPTDRVVRVYADGVFDLMHLGHQRQLEQAKNAFPNTHLTVGVTGDAETHKRKGLTVLSAAERAETVRHCRWVDEVIEDCPWIVTAEFLDKHAFDYVAHDDLPYGADEGDDIYRPIKEQGKFLVTQRTEGVSTTGIITKIVRDYEQYIARQLKRGTSRQELNISWLKKNELELKRHVKEIGDNLRGNWTHTGQEIVNRFLVPSRPQSPAPISATPRKGEEMQPASAVRHLGYLDIPRSPTSPTSPGSGANGEAASRTSSEFVRGYTLGLVGGIRSWMGGNRRNVLNGSRPPSPGSSDEEVRSPSAEAAASSSASAAKKRGGKASVRDEAEEDVISGRS